jgi:hypothetical protein
LWETDFAFRKPRCDVILNGCAHAPGGRPVERVPVGIKVGGWSKLFEVVGNREWRAIGPVFSSTAPEPFVKMPITYDRAWGGIDRLNPEDKLRGAFLANPVGAGWAQTKNQRFIPGLRLPNTQAIGEDIRSPFGDYRPMSFGPMGRGWPSSRRPGTPRPSGLGPTTAPSSSISTWTPAPPGRNWRRPRRRSSRWAPGHWTWTTRTGSGTSGCTPIRRGIRSASAGSSTPEPPGTLRTPLAP